MITMTNGSGVATTGLAANTSITVNEDQYRYLLTDATGRVTNVTWVSGATNPLGATTTTVIPQFAPDGSTPAVWSANLNGAAAGITGAAANTNLLVPFFITNNQGIATTINGTIYRANEPLMPIFALGLAGVGTGNDRSRNRLNVSDLYTLFNVAPPAVANDGLYDAAGLRDLNGNTLRIRQGTTGDGLVILGLGRRSGSGDVHGMIIVDRPAGITTSFNNSTPYIKRKGIMRY